MDSAGFDATQWNHWLLVAGFLAISLSGLRLSHQWRQEQRQQRSRARLSQRLSSEMYHFGKRNGERPTNALSKHVSVRNKDAKYTTARLGTGRPDAADRAADRAADQATDRYVRIQRRTYLTRIK